MMSFIVSWFMALGSVSVVFSIDVVEISVFRNELFCLYGDGRLSHLSLMSPERCVERLMKREDWTFATTVCCMFQHAIITSRVHIQSHLVYIRFHILF